MKVHLILLLLYTGFSIPCISQEKVNPSMRALEVACLIGDKLVRETPFAYKLELENNNNVFNGIQMVDFGRNFHVVKPAVAYAYTQLTVSEDREMTVQLGHNDACKIWLNGQEIYRKEGNRELELLYEERSMELPFRAVLKLKKGTNSLLIKSLANREKWQVYLQPPTTKGAVIKNLCYPEIGLNRMERVEKDVASVTNWLIIGPFPGNNGLDRIYPPEKEQEFGFMYAGSDGPVTWTIPKIDVIGNLIDSKPWGTNYHWNYHNGGVAWAMKLLGEMTGEKKYGKYADDFCDFQLRSIPFISYEKNTLGKDNVPNGLLTNTPLLDFKLAPSLPFIYRLRKEPSFPNRAEYLSFIHSMLAYARKEQVRLPGYSLFTRITPKKYTTWVDDMFMGIPFLIQSALLAETAADRNYYFDDAANQILDFNRVVWDEPAGLYVHARYSDSNEKMAYWSRANGWGIWAMSEALLYLPKDRTQYKAILEHFCKHAKSLIRYQNERGFWTNVIDHPESRDEVSGTAIFTMAMARGIREKWLDRRTYQPIVEKAWSAIKTQIDKDGTVHNICYGTMCTDDVNYYINRPFYDNDTHGLFAVLFAAMEVHRLLEESDRRTKEQISR
ncbi:glycoside hydrolase family 88/105 protein [Parabacteroides pacaensis]|uniref:glycoside hydrolase family 88/105 protein n=1 Tax=Parabacteroides pacaensis TaxID=2086575 RepID=UPI000D0EBC93|nr:glycoside hydrolase family 88 protein [Parabacteroides pacaensis]